MQNAIRRTFPDIFALQTAPVAEFSSLKTVMLPSE